MNVAHLLTQRASARPSAIAIVEKTGRQRRSITFAELDARSGRAAGMLRRDGIQAGDHVLLFVPMSIELYVALIAIFRVGAVATFLDPSVGKDHIARACQIAKPRGLIAISRAHLLRLTTPELRRIGRKYAIGWPVPGATRWSRGVRGQPDSEIVARSSDDPALLTFTSGSTGEPKAAVRSHAFLAAQHRALVSAIELNSGETDLATLPIFALVNLASGVTTVIPDVDLRRPGFVDGSRVLRQCERDKPSRAVASPAFFERLLAADDTGNLLRRFKRIYTGGAPVFPRLLRRLAAAMPDGRVFALYGSTEAEPIAHIAWDELFPDDLARMTGGAGLLAGRPVPEIQLRIIPNQSGQPLQPMDEGAFAQMALPPGKAGEIIVAGEHVLGGYLHGAGDEETKIAVDGARWHRTGDAGYLDDAGRLWLLGRAEATIDDSRGVLYPFAVECAVSEIESVRRSALLRVNNERVLAVEADDAVNDQTIAAAVEWARIDRIERVGRIPVDRRHNAKVDYPALRAMMSRANERRHGGEH